MDRRRFLALSVASGLAGCGADTRGSGTESGNAGTGTSSTATPEPTAVPPLDGDWSSYQHDAANTGATDDPGPGDEPVELWARTTATGPPATAPATADGTFVVVTDTGVIYARDATDGGIRWSTSLATNTGVAPVATDGTVVVAADRTLVGIAVATGTKRWTASLEGPVIGLAASEGRVVVTTESDVVAVATADGTTRWRRDLDRRIATPPGVGAGAVAVGVAPAGVTVLDAEAGRHDWHASVGAEPAFVPAIGNDHVYLDAGPRIVALDRDVGERRWARDTDAPVATSPAVTANGVYVATLDAGVGAPPSPSAGARTPTPPPTDTEWFAAAVTALDPADGGERWRIEATETYTFTGGPPERLPLVAANGRIVVGLGGTIRAYDAATGEEVWSASGGASPAATAGVVSTGAVGIDRVDGSIRWRFGTTSGVSPPVVLDNAVYVGSDDTYLYALAANTGSIRWSARTDGPVRATPAVRDGTVYVGNFSPAVTAVDAATGREAWRTEVERPAGTGFVALRLAATPATVFAGANGDLRAFDAGDGAERWRVTSDERPVVQSPPAVADGHVLVNIGGSLHAFDPADGTERWRRSTGGSDQPPVVRDGTVYAPGDGAVAAFDVTDGTRKWRTRVGDDLLLAVGDDALYGVGPGAPPIALDPNDGRILWRHAGVSSATPPAIADDYLFVGDQAGSVHAIGPDPG